MNPPVSTSEPNNAPFQLTQEDVRRLLSEPAAESRVAVVKKLVAGRESGNFSSKELLVAEQIFRLLLRDTEVQVRATMAESLQHDTTISKDIIMSLAADVGEVAAPILENSQILDDDDLIEIVRNNEEITKHIAIANRQHVSSAVSSALVETENEAVVGALVQNQGADISEKSFAKIVADFNDAPNVVELVVKRSNLPVTVVENLLNIVSGNVKKELKQKYSAVSRRVEEESQKTRESMTLKLLDNTVDPAEVMQLVAQLYDTGRLTPSMILTSLCRGNFIFFEYSLARMADIPHINARRLINDRGELGFRSLYAKAGLPESMFEACRLLLEVVRELSEVDKNLQTGTIHYANRVVEKLFARAEGKEVENLAYIIALIRQNVR